MRAKGNFPLSGLKIHPELIKALALVKKACARANLELGFLSPEIGQAIIAACEDVISGNLHDEIVVDALQGGAGTSSNMNINEVIANRAIAKGAAVAVPLAQGKVKIEPLISEVNLEKCSGCGICMPLCPYNAISLKENESGKLKASIEVSSCKGCGVCMAACPSQAIVLYGYTKEAIFGQIAALTA